MILPVRSEMKETSPAGTIPFDGETVASITARSLRSTRPTDQQNGHATFDATEALATRDEACW